MKILSPLSFIFAIIIAAAASYAAASTTVINSMIYMTASGQYKFTDPASSLLTGDVELATINMNFSVNVTGWDVLSITADANVLETNYTNAYYGAGYIEGFYTWEEILCNNYSSQGPPLTGGSGKWMEENIKWFSEYETNIPNSEYPEMLRPVASMYHQLLGLRDGINAAIDNAGSSAQKWNFYDVYALNMQAELSDVEVAGPAQFPSYEKTAPVPLPRLLPLEKTRLMGAKTSNLNFQRRGYGTHCSSLVRVTNDAIYYSHDTWSGFSSLSPRHHKTYNFENGVTFSGYAGQVSSIDDWYQTSHGLGVMETTIEQFNTTLTTMYVVPQTLPTFIRAMIANFWAPTPWKWSQLFLKFNSGTYNNEWQALAVHQINDDNLHNLPAGTFVVCDQLPGPYSACEDMTPRLNSEGYFPSYNIPAIKSVFDISGNKAAAKEYGNFFSYTRYARAEIFARNATMVQTLKEMQSMMRWNHWTIDPLSAINPQIPCDGCWPANNPQLAIANRADLVPKNATFGNLTFQANFFSGAAFGAIDSKISSNKMFDMNAKTFTSSMISGPSTSDGFLPPFDWRTTEYAAGTRHRGQVDLFDFDFVTMTSTMSRTLPLPTTTTGSPNASTTASATPIPTTTTSVPTTTTVPMPTPTPGVTMTLEASKLIQEWSCFTAVALDAGNDAVYMGTGVVGMAGIQKLYLNDLSMPSSLSIPEALSFTYGAMKPGSALAYFVSSAPLFGPNTNPNPFTAKVYEIDISGTVPSIKSSRPVPGPNGAAAGGVIVPTAVFDFDTGLETFSVGTSGCTLTTYDTNSGSTNSFTLTSSYTSQACIALELTTLTVPVNEHTSTQEKYLFALPACYGFGGYQQAQQLNTGCNLLKMDPRGTLNVPLAVATNLPPNFGTASMQIVNGIVLIVGGKSFSKVSASSMQVLGTMSTISNLHGPMTLDNSGSFAYVGTIGGASRLAQTASIIRVNLLQDVPYVDSVYTDLLPGSPVAFSSAFTSPKIDEAKNLVDVFFVSGPIAQTSLGTNITNATLYKFGVPPTVAPPTTSPAPYTPAPQYLDNSTYFELVFMGPYWPTKDYINERFYWFLANNSIPNYNQISNKIIGNMSSTPGDDLSSSSEEKEIHRNDKTRTQIYFELYVTNLFYEANLQQAKSLFSNSNSTQVAQAFGASEFETLYPRTHSPETPTSTPAPHGNNNNSPSSPKTGAIAGGVIGGIVVIILVIVVYVFVIKKKNGGTGSHSVRAELVTNREGGVESKYTNADV